jgi:hypothetical protein
VVVALPFTLKRPKLKMLPAAQALKATKAASAEFWLLDIQLEELGHARRWAAVGGGEAGAGIAEEHSATRSGSWTLPTVAKSITRDPDRNEFPSLLS